MLRPIVPGIATVIATTLAACGGPASPANSTLPGGQCNALLEKGVFDQFHMQSSRDARSSFKEALCTDKSATTKTSTSVGGSLSISIFAAEGHYGTEAFDEMRNRYCKDTSSAISDDDRNWIEREVASPLILKAWSDCMHDALGQAGIIATYDTTGSGRYFVIMVKWVAALGVNAVTLKDDVQVQGADCTRHLVLKKGATVQTEWITQQCERDPTSEVLVTISTTGGDSAPIVIPAASIAGSSSGAAFDFVQAVAALGSARVSECKSESGPVGTGHVAITFAPTGNVAAAILFPPFGGTETGRCLESKFKNVHIQPFSGAAMQVGKTFSLR
jgi:hypothetical protein